jgi:hypothetical protein
MADFKRFNSACVFVLLSLIITLALGCSASNEPQTGTATGLKGLAPDDILARYDTSNLIGLVVPRKENYSIVTHVIPATEQKNWDGIQSWGQANFWDADCNPLNIGEVVFNREWPNNTAANTSGNYYDTGDDMPFYTDGVTQNRISILASDGKNGSAVDSLSFGSMPHITNLVRGQNISRNSSLTVNWLGSSSDFVRLSLFVWDTTTGTRDTIGLGFGVDGFFDNSGSATLVVPKQIRKGQADIELRKYEPKFITLSNGKRVAIVAETGETITVNIVD